MMFPWRSLVANLLLLLLVGCNQKPAPAPVAAGVNPYGGYGVVDYRTIQFRDDAQTNAPRDVGVEKLKFLDIQGNEVSLDEFLGKKNVVLVVTRGYAGSICLYCSTQTSRLLSNYGEFTKRDAEVIVVFPVASADGSSHQPEFVSAVKEKLDVAVDKIPFPIVLDISLKAVDQLGIRKDLSKPATYILDKEGQTRFAYVGESLADRPSVKALLDQLDLLQAETTAPSEPQPSGEKDS